MLIVGTDKTETFLATLPESYLLIDDGKIIDALDLPKGRAIMRFDPTRHSFNPLTKRDHIKARALAETIYAANPQGENTLTVRNGKRTLARFLKSAKRLDKFPTPTTDAQQEVKDILNDIFLSPVLERVLLGEPNFSLHTFDGIALARLDPAELGDFDCFLLGNLLAAEYRGLVVMPDFAFYATTSHIRLMRQERLTAGLNFLDEVPLKIRNNLLLMEPERLFTHRKTKVYAHYACRTTIDDAETLAKFAGLRPDREREDNAYNAFIEDAMR